MAFCSKCGTEIPAGSSFCPNCGERLGGADIAGIVTEKFNQFNNTEDTTYEYSTQDIASNRGIAWLSYMGLLFLIPLFVAKDSSYARFHVNQGIVLAIVEAAWFITQTVLSMIFLSISYKLAFLSTLLGLVNIVFLVFSIIGIVNAAKGRAKELPIIGGIRILK